MRGIFPSASPGSRREASADIAAVLGLGVRWLRFHVSTTMLARQLYSWLHRASQHVASRPPFLDAGISAQSAAIFFATFLERPYNYFFSAFKAGVSSMGLLFSEQNEVGMFGVLRRMACDAENFDVGAILFKLWVRGDLFNVMAVKNAGASASLAFAAFKDDCLEEFARRRLSPLLAARSRLPRMETGQAAIFDHGADVRPGLKLTSASDARVIRSYRHCGTGSALKSVWQWANGSIAMARSLLGWLEASVAYAGRPCLALYCAPSLGSSVVGQ